VNTEEQQLSDMLRRVTPEPPRRVTVEDVAFQLANQAAGSRRHREPRAERGSLGHGSPGRRSERRGSWSRAWVPALAAASVVVVAAASAGIATLATSHRAPASSAGSAVSSSSVSSPAPSQRPTSQGPGSPPVRVADGMWGAELITRDTFTQDSLTSGNGSLYAISGDYLDRIDPATGDVVDDAPFTPPIANLPIVTGNTVWVVASYAGMSVVLQGYNGKTLAPVASIIVPVSGQVSTTASGVLTTGSGGYLYVAAGSDVVVVDPGTHRVVKQISDAGSGPVRSVAVSPDGTKLYVSTSGVLLVYDPATGAQLSVSAIPGLPPSLANLVATSGGVWGTTGVGMTESARFAPNGYLTRMVGRSSGTGAGLDSVPSYSGGTVWIGGSHTLACANPVTGQVLKTVTIPTDGGVLEYFGSVTVASGRTYALYLNDRSHQVGVVRLTPPAACSG
jgi:YVTN family beta-propeller protein